MSRAVLLVEDNEGNRLIYGIMLEHAGEEQKARDMGCDGYLSKPVEPRRVLEEVRRFIGAADP